MIPLARYCLISLLLPWPVFAAEAEATAALSLGYRLDALDWSIDGAGNPVGSEPNILSELEWRDTEIVQLKAELVGTNRAGFYFRGSAALGRSFDGENQDSDYAGDNRTLEFSRSLNDTNGSEVLDLGGGLGYTFFLGVDQAIRLVPMVGYSYHQQRLRMRNGNQVLWDADNAAIYDPGIVSGPPLGPFAGLDSSYEAHWFGPWLGVDLRMDLAGGSAVFARVEAHQATYFAQADWNLRDDFAHPVSFEHEADGRGWVLELGWQALPSRYQWTWGVTLSLQDWTTNSGTDRTFFADNTFSEGRLNGANWSSRSLSIGLNKAFEN
ncbi:MAG: hypothetical protein RRB22_05840 [Gammaproteobacteria bacterium]|nr:hypothetical protein [Gammaproteobacteria bacterium]